jgi:hypothetical protein
VERQVAKIEVDARDLRLSVRFPTLPARWCCESRIRAIAAKPACTRLNEYAAEAARIKKWLSRRGWLGTGAVDISPRKREGTGKTNVALKRRASPQLHCEG